MPDIIKEKLQIIIESIQMIETRFSRISKADDLVLSEEGVLILDSIAIRLQVIGETLKKISKIDESLLDRYPMIEWDKIIKLRDLISHHYDLIDYEVIFDICDNHISELKTVINLLIKNEFGSDKEFPSL
ncbi:MAG TPA: toxin-antitoxin system antitoxin subunit [Desulfobacteraceae bacterium]|nr:toxin-antitoxin system antitoxin subunit [Desulfobacteraceae bacterium]